MTPNKRHVSVNKVCSNFWSLVSTCTYTWAPSYTQEHKKKSWAQKNQKSERENDSKVLSYNSWLDSEKVVAAPSTEWVCTDVGRAKVWFIDLWSTLEWPRMNGVTVLKVQDNMGHFVTQETKVVGLCQSWPQRDKMSMIVLGGEILEWVLEGGSRGQSVDLGSPRWLSSVT